MCCLFRHAEGTTGTDAAARRKHTHAPKCAQCGVAVTDTTRVAAHLHVRACGCGPRFTTLRTTCKKCNHHKSPRKTFWGFKRHLVRLRRARASAGEPSH